MNIQPLLDHGLLPLNAAGLYLTPAHINRLWHQLARKLWKADILKLPASERYDWEGETLAKKLEYQRKAKEQLGLA